MEKPQTGRIEMNRWHSAFALCLASGLLLAGCPKASKEEVLREYPVDGLEGVLTKSGIALDETVTSDGNGSLRVSADQPRQVRLFETGDLDIENARLIYRAKLRTENVEGKVYLEMWCRFPGKGEFFSRALNDPLMGSSGWTTQETPFFLKKGENPDNVKLNLVIEGTGSVWIDDIRLTKGPLS
jgi:hypothetical protein